MEKFKNYFRKLNLSCLSRPMNYTVIFTSNNAFPIDDVIPIYRIRPIDDFNIVHLVSIRGNKYVLKKIDKDCIEWDIIRHLSSKRSQCPYLIPYYAGLRKGNKRYILMKLADTDLYHYYQLEPLYRTHFIDVIQTSLNFFNWTIRHLNLITIDLKMKNLVLLNNPYPKPRHLELRAIDVELMEKPDTMYYPDIPSLTSSSTDNQMYPRSECTYQQFALFSLGILLLEMMGVYESLIIGRKDDSELITILVDLAILDNEPQLLGFTRKLLTFKYQTVKGALREFREFAFDNSQAQCA